MTDSHGGPTAPDLDRLRTLGVRWKYFEEAIRSGEAGRREATPSEPPTAPGLRDWIARVGMLRYTMAIEEGWTPHNHNNMALSVNPERTIALGVLAGDAGTGWPQATPKSRYPKGSAFSEAVANNLTLFSNADLGHPEVLDEETVAALDLWLLLTHRVRTGDKVTVYSELSRPRDVSSSGYIVGWHERVILPALTFESVIERDRDEDGGFEVLVEEI
ncbi:hypothetical protein [Streptomyces sp. NEAU-H3]|uniref:hypothetical protein n=1 Tax=Streptomyces sp. NEAU-H3 TaxID=2720636 RepID=UPI00143A2EF5|nr:hypothetical protein [Streptomyces sp. NEAU-H3]NJA56278.1 hypothetical protein [Streptomyces sp. NEAU-H3]